jgi:hypothetical protein
VRRWRTGQASSPRQPGSGAPRCGAAAAGADYSSAAPRELLRVWSPCPAPPWEVGRGGAVVLPGDWWRRGGERTGGSEAESKAVSRGARRRELVGRVPPRQSTLFCGVFFLRKNGNSGSMHTRFVVVTCELMCRSIITRSMSPCWLLLQMQTVINLRGFITPNSCP